MLLPEAMAPSAAHIKNEFQKPVVAEKRSQNKKNKDAKLGRWPLEITHYNHGNKHSLITMSCI